MRKTPLFISHVYNPFLWYEELQQWEPMYGNVSFHFFLFQRRVCVHLRSVYWKGDNDFWRSGQDNPQGVWYLFFFFLIETTAISEIFQKYVRKYSEKYVAPIKILMSCNIVQNRKHLGFFIFLGGDERLLNENLNENVFRAEKYS